MATSSVPLTASETTEVSAPPACGDLPVLVEAVLRARSASSPVLERAVGAAADLVVQPGCIPLAAALLEAVKSDRTLLTLTVQALAERSEILDREDLTGVVSSCRSAVGCLSERSRDVLLDRLVERRCFAFLGADLELTIERGPIEDVAGRFARDFGRLPPSARGRLDLDLLVARCLSRFGAVPLSSQLDELLDVVPLKELRDDLIQEAVAARYAGALDLADVEARHERRLAYLLRFASDRETRARLKIREDLSRLVTLPSRPVGTGRVVGRLEFVPGALVDVPANEVERFVALVLRRLPSRLNEDDHVSVGRKLYHPLHGEEYHRAMSARLKHLGAGLAEELRGEVWAAYYAAWLSGRMGDASEDMRTRLKRDLKKLEARTRRDLLARLKHRFGKGSELLRG